MHIHDDVLDGSQRRTIHEMFSPAHLTCHDVVKTSDGKEIWRERQKEAGNKKKKQEYSVSFSHRIVKRLKRMHDEKQTTMAEEKSGSS